MSRKEKSRIDTGGGNGLGVNPFGNLGGLGNLPAPSCTESSAKPASGKVAQSSQAVQGGNAERGGPVSANGQGNGSALSAAATGAKRFSGRIDVRREKSGRGGKVVTTLSGEGLTSLSEAERDALLKQLKNRFGCGGSREGTLLEVQGNLVEQLTPVLTQMGWRVVRTGG